MALYFFFGLDVLKPGEKIFLVWGKFLIGGNGKLNIWFMRFHFRASIKPILKIMFLEPFGALFTLLKGRNRKMAGRFLFMGL